MNSDTGLFGLTLTRNAMVYCALDTAQRTKPHFMRTDPKTGGWEYTGYVLQNSIGGHFSIWKKFIPAGRVSFDGARSGGEEWNSFNYVLFAHEYQSPDSVTTNHPTIANVNEGDTIYLDIPSSVKVLPSELIDATVIRVPSQTDTCTTIAFTLHTPARVSIAVDPSYRTEGTFIDTMGFTRTGKTITLTGGVPQLDIWQKDMQPGDIRFPGIHCDGYKPGLFNYIVFIQPMAFPVRGYYAKNQTVRGFGDERSAESASWRVRNLDVKYAYGLHLTSPSWIMKIRAQGGTQNVSDTVKVLTPFTDSVITMKTKDTERQPVHLTDSARLAELMPVLIDADSVQVSAVDLATTGSVRITFRNASSVPVKQEFAIVLFEDMNGDYAFDYDDDKYLGRAYVKGIEGNEFLIYEIDLQEKLSFPERTIMAFVDADRWVEEINERNNVIAAGTTCEGYEPPAFNADWNWRSDEKMSAAISEYAQVAPCYLVDTDGDSVVNDNDSLYLVYIDEYRLHAINTITGDSLFGSFYIDSRESDVLLIDDITGDNIPEIIVGNTIYSNKGELVWDLTRREIPALVSTIDINRDGTRDSVTLIDSCITIWSGHDNALLYVYPFNRWTGQQHQVTTGVLAKAAKGWHSCYDISISYPRIEQGNDGGVSVTVRVGNAGSAPIDSGVTVECYQRKTDGERLVLGKVQTRTKLTSGNYEDVTLRLMPVPETGTELKCIVDSENRYFECDERNNMVKIQYQKQ